MANFDYAQQIAIGQYMPLRSLVHQLDPRARILGFMMIIAALTFSQSLTGLAIGLVAILFLMTLSQIPVRFGLRSLLTPLPFLVFLAILQLFITPVQDSMILWQWQFLHISVAGVRATVMLILRFSALILAISLASFTLSFSELVFGLRKLLAPLSALRLPVNDMILMAQVTLRFIPLLALTAERIAKAQASRGAEWGSRSGSLFHRIRAVLPLIVPLFLITLRRAENLALAIDARAYGANQQPGSFFAFTFKTKDAAGLIIGIILSALIVVVSYPIR